MKYVIAIDEGTSSCRALLVNQEGSIVNIAQKEFGQIFPMSDWVEHNPLEILEVQLSMVDQVICNNHINPKDIVAIGITNQRETTVVWNKNTGQPVYNAIVWQDKRTAGVCKTLKDQGHEAYIYDQTGLPIDAYFSGTKLKWILDNVDVGNKEELLFGTIDTWLIWNMTNRKVHATDYTNASRTLLFNIRQKQWDDKILELLAIPKSMLPEVKNSAASYGSYNYKGHEIPIAGVAGDQQAALFGQGCFAKGSAKNTYGTGCFMLMNVGDKFIPSANGLLTTLCCNAKGEPVYALEGAIFVAGAAIQWLRDGIKIIDDSKETESMALDSTDNHDVMFVPAMAGLAAPYWDMDARGMIIGITRATTQADIVKATLDAMAYRTKDVLTAMQSDSKIDLTSLKVDGGACQNNYLMQFQADMLGVTVLRPKVIESTAMGAAYLAGIQVGLWDSDIVSRDKGIDREFVPRKEAEKVATLYRRWLDAVSRTRGWKTT